jgi:phosphoglycolate phosphatase-like HAD superfamily hydrolase
MIKLVIFDFDDTLIDNQILDYQSFKVISLSKNLPYPTKNELTYLRKNNYLASDIVSWISSKSTIEFNKKLFLKNRRIFLQNKNSINYLKIHSHVKNTFRFLKVHEIKIIICSLRTKKKIIELFLEKNKLSDYVDVIINNECNKLQNLNKKQPKNIKNILFKKILKTFTLKNSEVLSIGDSLIDENAAKKNHIAYFTMRFPNDPISRQKLKNQIHSFKKIPDFLYRINNYR